MSSTSSQVTGGGPKVTASSGRKRRVFIVEDHPIFRHGLLQIIESEPGLEVCGTAATAAEAVAGLKAADADAAVIDISLPGASGIDLIKDVRAQHPFLPVLAISAYDERLYAMRAIRAGASGYLMKRESEQHFVTALRKVLAGETWVSATFGGQLIYQVSRAGVTGTSPLDVLTPRELEVLRLVGEGKSSKEVAETLDLSVKTVETHRLHIKEKLGLHSSNELVRFASDWVAHESG